MGSKPSAPSSRLRGAPSEQPISPVNRGPPDAPATQPGSIEKLFNTAFQDTWPALPTSTPLKSEGENYLTQGWISHCLSFSEDKYYDNAYALCIRTIEERLIHSIASVSSTKTAENIFPKNLLEDVAAGLAPRAHTKTIHSSNLTECADERVKKTIIIFFNLAIQIEILLPVPTEKDDTLLDLAQTRVNFYLYYSLRVWARDPPEEVRLLWQVGSRLRCSVTVKKEGTDYSQDHNIPYKLNDTFQKILQRTNDKCAKEQDLSQFLVMHDDRTYLLSDRITSSLFDSDEPIKFMLKK